MHSGKIRLRPVSTSSSAPRQGRRRVRPPAAQPAAAITERTNNNGTRFWVHRYSDGVGRRHEDYLGTSGDEEVRARVRDLRGRIEAANATLGRIRILARAGFASADRKTYSTLANLHNHGLFRAGALLIGSHAFGVLLNVLGVKAVRYATEDVDIARREQLALPGIPPLLKVLRETGIEFFDLLVPSPDETYPTIKVPGLNAYAQGLPYLKYLLSNSQEAPILSPHGVVMVRVPVPERYAIHKLMVSQLRGTASSKAAKDLHQAATLLEAVVEQFPGAIEDALSAVPKSAVRYLRRAIPALKRHLPASAEAVWAVLPSRTLSP
jgi:hypothetical protein